MPPTELRPRSATEIIDAAFQILKRHYSQFLVIAALAYLPFFIVSIAAESAMPATTIGATPSFGEFVPILVMLSLALLWFPIAEAAVFVGASDALLRGSVSAGDAFRQVFRKFPTLLGAAILKWLTISMAMTITMLPAMALLAVTAAAGSAILTVVIGTLVIFGVMFVAMLVYVSLYATSPAIVLENVGAVESIGRSWRLSEGLRWKAFGAIVLAWLLIVAPLLAMMMIFATIFENPVIAQTAANVLSVLIYPVLGITFTLLYYDARIRKEGFDLQLLAGDLEGGPPATPYAERR